MRFFSGSKNSAWLYTFRSKEGNDHKWEIMVISRILEDGYIVILTYLKKGEDKNISISREVKIPIETRKKIAHAVIKLRREIMKSLKDESSKYACKGAYIWDESRTVHV